LGLGGEVERVFLETVAARLFDGPVHLPEDFEQRALDRAQPDRDDPEEFVSWLTDQLPLTVRRTGLSTALGPADLDGPVAGALPRDGSRRGG